MIAVLLLAMLAQPKGGYEPPPALWYQQAVACAASGKVAGGKAPDSETFGEMMTWGMIMADSGRKSGRTREQVDSGDLDAAYPFYVRLSAKKPKAFAAHRAYCQALLDADRP
jgi:hypothetical protein